MATNKSLRQSLARNPLLLPVAALIIMLCVNVIITPSFFKISIQNGVL